MPNTESKTGPKTELTDELMAEIKQCILDGKSIRETAEYCFEKKDSINNLSIEEREKEKANFIQKVYNWKYLNYLNLNEKIENWKRDRKMILAGDNVEEILTMKCDDDVNKLRVKADISKFVLSNLDPNYKIKTDITSDNEKIQSVQFEIVASKETEEKTEEKIEE